MRLVTEQHDVGGAEGEPGTGREQAARDTRGRGEQDESAGHARRRSAARRGGRRGGGRLAPGTNERSSGTGPRPFSDGSHVPKRAATRTSSFVDSSPRYAEAASPCASSVPPGARGRGSACRMRKSRANCTTADARDELLGREREVEPLAAALELAVDGAGDHLVDLTVRDHDALLRRGGLEDQMTGHPVDVARGHLGLAEGGRCPAGPGPPRTASRTSSTAAATSASRTVWCPRPTPRRPGRCRTPRGRGRRGRGRGQRADADVAGG